MYASNTVANGGRLDDCHSSVFSLAELNGIKWRTYTSIHSFPVLPNEDPILQAFSKCLASDILAVWRRCPKNTSTSFQEEEHNTQSASLDYKKELWIFWWGQEPRIDAEMSSISGLQETGNGSYEEELSYDCRTLLFKAIHNLVERCLLMENFVRIGRWFVKPLQEDDDPSDRLSCSFSFFLHGESSVCTTVEIACHTPVTRLNSSHFNRPTENSQLKVILAPYGLQGTLTGVSHKSKHDVSVKKIFEEWKPFYPLPPNDPGVNDDRNDFENEDVVPPMVEVIAAGVRMDYPSHYVLVTSEQRKHNSKQKTEGSAKDDNVKTPRLLESMLTSVYNRSTSKKSTQRNGKTPVHPVVKQSPSLAMALKSNDEKETKPKWNFLDAYSEPRGNVSENPLPNGDLDPLDQISRVHSESIYSHSESRRRSEKSKQRPTTAFHRQHATKSPVEEVLHRHMTLCQNSPAISQPQYTNNVFLSPPRPIEQKNEMNNLLLHQNQDDTMYFNNEESPFVQPGMGSNTMPFAQVNLNQYETNDNMMSNMMLKNDEKHIQNDFREISVRSSCWVKCKLPHMDAQQHHNTTSSSNKQNRPTMSSLARPVIPSDSLDPLFLEVSRKQKLKREWLFGSSSSKRRKFDEEEMLPPANTGMMIEPPLPDNQPQYTVGPTTGSLAGMAVPSDPYQFEDEVDDSSVTFPDVSSHDINLKQHDNHPYSVNNNHLDHHLSQTMLSPIQGYGHGNQHNVSLKDAKDLKVSPFDQVQMFDNEDAGMPTPPTDPNNDVLEGTQHLNVPDEDGQMMFPTPPSQEQQQHCSPDNRKMYQDHQMSVFAKPVMHRYPQPPEVKWEAKNFIDQTPTTKNVDVAVVYCKQMKSEHPMPDEYSPISPLPSCKENNMLPPCYSYTPSWHAGYMQPIMTQSIQRQQCTFQPPLTPKTPAGSVRTPSQPQPSPGNFPTPAPRTPRTPRTPRVATDNLVSPSTSIATPHTGGKHFPQLHSVQSTYSVEPSVLNDDCKASAVQMNILLSDSVLNVFRDQSFDQCALCVCNNNIRSRDVDHGYLPTMGDTTPQFLCSCGFSAIRNRLLSIGTGLFLEDELEIAGKDLEDAIMCAITSNQSQLNEQSMALVLRVALDRSQNVYHHLWKNHKKIDRSLLKAKSRQTVKQFDFACACVEAINGGITVLETNAQSTTISLRHCDDIMHEWFLSRTDTLISAGSRDLYRLLLLLQPVLQDAIQRKRSTRSFDNNTQLVKGPLTWREFCKDASRAMSDPLPVPSVITGYDPGFLHVSPYSLKYWEKLNLEPYSHQSNIAYIVLCPDVEAMINSAKTYFGELSATYESCRLGFHKPMNRFLKDGILRVGNDFSTTTDLFTSIQDSLLGRKNSFETHPRHSHDDMLQLLKLYVNACQDILFPLLSALSQLYMSTFYSTRANPNQPNVSLPQGVLTPSQQINIGKPQTPPTVKLKDLPPKVHGHNNVQAQSIVLYMVDPFSGKSDIRVSVAMWYIYQQIVNLVPEPLKSIIVIQLVPIEQICHSPETGKVESLLSSSRGLAFSSYTQCRTKMAHSLRIKTMTSFGPIEATKKMIKEDDSIKFYDPVSICSPPYVLVVPRNLQYERIDTQEVPCNVLYVTYCISHDQNWILASATDQAGEILQTFAINITVPPKRVSLHRKKRLSAKCDGLRKLWNSCVSIVMAGTGVRWRVVIGRMGRLSHGEIHEWSKHLNRRKLPMLSRQIASSCPQCALNSNHRHPSIITACLTSVEPEGAFRLLPDVVQQITTFGRTGTSSNVNLKTPRDNSCSHIYVFPPSSTTSVPDYSTNDIDTTDNLLTGEGFLPDIDDTDVFEGMGIFGDDDMHNDTIGTDKPSASHLMSHDSIEEESTLLQQPLALGYLVSTAPTGHLPEWFWGACPHAQYQNPVFLRFALHIQVSNEDLATMGNPQRREEPHMLDSTKTAEVLRHVMEKLNDLSWLTCDPVNHDRTSCLPIHMVALSRLYDFLKNILSA